jgi:hypothetical protein
MPCDATPKLKVAASINIMEMSVLAIRGTSHFLSIVTNQKGICINFFIPATRHLIFLGQ